MSNYVVADPFIGAPTPVSVTDTVARWPLGLEVRAVDNGSGSAQIGGAVFRYCQGSDVGTSGLVVYIQNNSAVKLAAAQPFPVGVAAGVLDGTSKYGWVQVQGICDYGRGTNVALTSVNPVFIGTAGGFLVSGSVANSRIIGMVAGANYTSSQSLSMTLELNRPYVQNLTASM